MKEKEKNKNQFILFMFVLILLGCAGYALFLVYRMLFTDIEVDTIQVVIVLIPVFIIGPLISKFATNVNNKPKNNGKYTFDNNQNPNKTHSFDNSNYYNNQQSSNNGFDNANSSNYDNNDLNNGNKFPQSPNQLQPAAEGKKPVNKNLIPSIILVVVFIVFFAYQGGYLNFFNNSDPVGKWIYQMEEGETIGGVTNLTDYWYMEFYENGTLDIGWKNVDYPEDSQGSGSWYVEGGVIYVIIHYNYGDTVNAEFVIKSNQLVEYGTNVPSAYFRE
jgi:hypothetical protein